MSQLQRRGLFQQPASGFPAAAARFRADHPDVKLDLRPAAADVPGEILSGASDLYCGLLGRDPLPDGLRREAGWGDLADYPWIDYGGLRALLDDIHRHAGRPVGRLLRAGAGGLLLMQGGPYLSRLPIELLDRLPGAGLLSPEGDLEHIAGLPDAVIGAGEAVEAAARVRQSRA